MERKSAWTRVPPHPMPDGFETWRHASRPLQRHDCTSRLGNQRSDLVSGEANGDSAPPSIARCSGR